MVSWPESKEQQIFWETYRRTMEEYISEATEAQLERLGCLIFRLDPEELVSLSNGSD